MAGKAICKYRLKTFLLCSFFALAVLVMNQWQHRLTYVAMSRSTLKYAYKNLDNMLSEIEGDTEKERRDELRILKASKTEDEDRMRGKSLRRKHSGLQKLLHKNNTIANQKLTRDGLKKQATDPSKSETEAKCLNLGSTFNLTRTSTFTTLIVVPVPESNWKRGDAKTAVGAHSKFLKQFSTLFLQTHHILFVWNLDIKTDVDNVRDKLKMLKSVVRSLLGQVRKSKQKTFVTFFVCIGDVTTKDHRVFQTKLAEGISPYLKGFGSQKKRIVVSSLQTNFIAHKIGGGKTRDCPNNRKAIKQYGCDCSWATSERVCLNDGSNCFKTCCCKYFDPTGLDRLTNGFLVQYEKNYKDFGEIYAIGGYKIGAGRKTGLSCFTKYVEEFPRKKYPANLPMLARTYKHEIGSGKHIDGTHSSGMYSIYTISSK